MPGGRRMKDSKKDQKDRGTQADVIEQVERSGRRICYERYEGIVDVIDIGHCSEYRVACERCPQHGKNLSCPPHSPAFMQYLEGEKRARVICLRLPLEYFSDQEDMEKHKVCFRKASGLLAGELLEYRKRGLRIAGSGPCLACQRCAVETGDQKCKKPDKMIYSLESLGVNVTALVQACFNIDFEWSVAENTADFVCAVGAVFEK
jgi:predicted metal-binding protein